MVVCFPRGCTVVEAERLARRACSFEGEMSVGVLKGKRGALPAGSDSLFFVNRERISARARLSALVRDG